MLTLEALGKLSKTTLMIVFQIRISRWYLTMFQEEENQLVIKNSKEHLNGLFLLAQIGKLDVSELLEIGCLRMDIPQRLPLRCSYKKLIRFCKKD